MTDRTPTCEQVRLLDGTPTLIRHGHGIEEPCPFDRASAEGLRAALERWGQLRGISIDGTDVAYLLAALRDTGPRPDSDIDERRLDVQLRHLERLIEDRLWAHALPYVREMRADLSTPRTETSEPRQHDPEFWADCAEGRCPHVSETSEP